jgi:hypothetical protein
MSALSQIPLFDVPLTTKHTLSFYNDVTTLNLCLVQSREILDHLNGKPPREPSHTEESEDSEDSNVSVSEDSYDTNSDAWIFVPGSADFNLIVFVCGWTPNQCLTAKLNKELFEEATQIYCFYITPFGDDPPFNRFVDTYISRFNKNLKVFINAVQLTPERLDYWGRSARTLQYSDEVASELLQHNLTNAEILYMYTTNVSCPVVDRRRSTLCKHTYNLYGANFAPALNMYNNLLRRYYSRHVEFAPSPVSNPPQTKYPVIHALRGNAFIIDGPHTCTSENYIICPDGTFDYNNLLFVLRYAYPAVRTIVDFVWCELIFCVQRQPSNWDRELNLRIEYLLSKFLFVNLKPASGCLIDAKTALLEIAQFENAICFPFYTQFFMLLSHIACSNLPIREAIEHQIQIVRHSNVVLVPATKIAPLYLFVLYNYHELANMDYYIKQLATINNYIGPFMSFVSSKIQLVQDVVN